MDNEPSSYYNIYPLLHYPYNCLVLEYVMTSSSESFIIEENVIPLSLFLALFHSLSKLFEYFLVFFKQNSIHGKSYQQMNKNQEKVWYL